MGNFISMLYSRGQELFVLREPFKKSKSSFLRPMADRAAPISVSIALGHASANAVKATARGWSTSSPASLTFSLHSHMSSTRREGSEYHFESLWYDSAGARTHDLPVVRQMLYHWAITPVREPLEPHILKSISMRAR